MHLFLVITALCSLLTSFSAFAQSERDSLEQLLTTNIPDTQKVLIMDDLGWMLKNQNPDSARMYLKRALDLSEKIGYTIGLSKAWNDLGVVETIHSNFDAAQEAYENALKIRESLNDKKGIASVYNNLANVMDSKGDFLEALKQYKASLKVIEELGDTARIARLYYNLGDLHERMGNYLEAQDNIHKYLIYTEKNNDFEGQAYGQNLLGNIYYGLIQTDIAMDWYQMAYVGFDTLGMDWEKAGALNNIASILGDDAELEVDSGHFERAMMLFDSAINMELRVIEIRKEVEDIRGLAEAYNNLGVFFKDKGSFFKKMNQPGKASQAWNTALDYFQQSLAIRKEEEDKKGVVEVLNGFGDVYRRQKDYTRALDYTKQYLKLALEINDKRFEQSAYKDLSKIYAEKGDFKNAYEYRKAYDELRYDQLDEQRTKEFARRQTLYGDQQKEIALEREQQRNALLDAQVRQREAEIRQATIMRNSLFGGALGLTILLGLLWNRNRIKTRANKDLAEKNEIIEQERKRSDDLLLNILPEKTAEELKEKGKAKARKYDEVTVLFSDFKSFTTIAEQMSPEDLVDELDECFRAFDAITARHGVEKIKTIGDAYMCVGGLPEPNTTHAKDVLQAAIEMQEWLKERKKSKPSGFEMRIGIHTGPVVAGIVGSRKFAYDIWGDTVNLAARMEQNSEPGKINISKDTWERVKEDFSCVYRGEITAKNKGEVDMFFVEA
ncbi:MAG: tetratricopeptide repeat protein [Saprospiraceae bacterium]|nr:tetratricopeptide repeat protein [Saprospiraceae bacterium]